jgi:hypothetical protein
MATTTTLRRSRTKELKGIRLRGGSYQVRVYGGRDPETGKQVILTGSAQDESGAIRLRDRFRADIARLVSLALVTRPDPPTVNALR